MRDNEIWAALIEAFDLGFAGQGRPDIGALQAEQPTAQGAATGPALYLTKLGDRPLGSPERTTSPDPDNVLGVIRREAQVYLTTFQATGVFKQEAGDVAGFTASDVANLGRAILQMEATMDRLRAAGLGMLRPGDVRNPYFVNGEGNFEASPSFDFTLTHEQVTFSKTPAATVTAFRQYPV